MTEDQREFRCLDCRHEWQVPFGGGRQVVCPKCQNTRIRRTNPGRRPGFGGWRRRGRPSAEEG